MSNESRQIIVVGGGGHAKVIISMIKTLGDRTCIGYTDNVDNGSILGIPYLGNDDLLRTLKLSVQDVVIAIADSDRRYELSNYVLDEGYKCPSIVSRNAFIQEGVVIGDGSVVMPGAVVNVGANIGKFSIVNTNASIDHDTSVGDYSHIAPGATLCGYVSIGEFTLVGAGATVIQEITVDARCIIGAGSVVLMPCLQSGTYVGAPAKLNKPKAVIHEIDIST